MPSPQETERKTRKLASEASNPRVGQELASFQAGQNELLGIQNQQQALLREQMLAQQSQAAQNQTLQQAGEMGMIAAMGEGSQGLAGQIQQMKPGTQATLAKYGVKTGAPKVQQSQGRNVQVTPNKVTVNNTTYTTIHNDTKINAPQQAAPVVVNGGGGGKGGAGAGTLAKFKTWMSNAFARQREEQVIRQKEYQRKEWSLSRSASRMMRGLEKLGKTFAERLDPRKLSNSKMSTMKLLSYMMTIQMVKQYWPQILEGIKSVVNTLTGLGKYFGFSGESSWADSGFRKDILGLLGANGENKDIPSAFKSLFWDPGDKSGKNKGIINYLMDKFKEFWTERAEAVSQIKFPDFNTGGDGSAGWLGGLLSGLSPMFSGLGKYLSDIFQALLSGKSAINAIAERNAINNTLSRWSAGVGEDSKTAGVSRNSNAKSYNDVIEVDNPADGGKSKVKVHRGDKAAFLANNYQDFLNNSDVQEDGGLANNVGSTARVSNIVRGVINNNDTNSVRDMMLGMSMMQAMAVAQRGKSEAEGTNDNGVAVSPGFIRDLESKYDINVPKRVGEYKYVLMDRAEKEKFLAESTRNFADHLKMGVGMSAITGTLGLAGGPLVSMLLGSLGMAFGQHASELKGKEEARKLREDNNIPDLVLVPSDYPIDNSKVIETVKTNYLTADDFENIQQQIAKKVGYENTQTPGYFNYNDYEFIAKLSENFSDQKISDQIDYQKKVADDVRKKYKENAPNGGTVEFTLRNFDSVGTRANIFDRLKKSFPNWDDEAINDMIDRNNLVELAQNSYNKGESFSIPEKLKYLERSDVRDKEDWSEKIIQSFNHGGITKKETLAPIKIATTNEKVTIRSDEDINKLEERRINNVKQIQRDKDFTEGKSNASSQSLGDSYTQGLVEGSRTVLTDNSKDRSLSIEGRNAIKDKIAQTNFSNDPILSLYDSKLHKFYLPDTKNQDELVKYLEEKIPYENSLQFKVEYPLGLPDLKKEWNKKKYDASKKQYYDNIINYVKSTNSNLDEEISKYVEQNPNSDYYTLSDGTLFNISQYMTDKQQGERQKSSSTKTGTSFSDTNLYDAIEYGVDKAKNFFNWGKNAAMTAFGSLTGKSIPKNLGISDQMVQNISVKETGHNYGYSMEDKDLNGYPDGKTGHKSYGYGLQVHPIENKYMDEVKDSYSQEELQGLFITTLGKASKEVDDWAKANNVTLTQGQKDAMVSGIYNFGTGFLKKDIVKKIAANPNDETITEDWKHLSDSQLDKYPGLKDRREFEANWYSGQAIGSSTSKATLSLPSPNTGKVVSTTANANDSVQWAMNNVVGKINTYADGKGGRQLGGFKKTGDNTIETDCSGMICEAYKSIGVSIPSGTAGQIAIGEWVDEGGANDKLEITDAGALPNVDNLQPGDLLFYRKVDLDNDSRNLRSRPYGVGHVEMYMGNGKKLSGGSSGERKISDISSTPKGQVYIGSKRIVGSTEGNKLQYAAGYNYGLGSSNNSGGLFSGGLFGGSSSGGIFGALSEGVKGIFGKIKAGFESLADLGKEEDKWEQVSNPINYVRGLENATGQKFLKYIGQREKINIPELMSKADPDYEYRIDWNPNVEGDFKLYRKEKEKTSNSSSLINTDSSIVNKENLTDNKQDKSTTEISPIIEKSEPDLNEKYNDKWQGIDYMDYQKLLSNGKETYGEGYSEALNNSKNIFEDADILSRFDPNYDYKVEWTGSGVNRTPKASRREKLNILEQKLNLKETVDKLGKSELNTSAEVSVPETLEGIKKPEEKWEVVSDSTVQKTVELLSNSDLGKNFTQELADSHGHDLAGILTKYDPKFDYKQDKIIGSDGKPMTVMMRKEKPGEDIVNLQEQFKEFNDIITNAIGDLFGIKMPEKVQNVTDAEITSGNVSNATQSMVDKIREGKDPNSTLNNTMRAVGVGFHEDIEGLRKDIIVLGKVACEKGNTYINNSSSTTNTVSADSMTKKR